MTAVPIITDNHGITITFSSNDIFETNYSANLTLNANNTVFINSPGVYPSSTLSNLIIIGSGGGSSELKKLIDVDANTNIEDNYMLVVNTHGTANTTDDTYEFKSIQAEVANVSLDGGSF